MTSTLRPKLRAARGDERPLAPGDGLRAFVRSPLDTLVAQLLAATLTVLVAFVVLLVLLSQTALPTRVFHWGLNKSGGALGELVYLLESTDDATSAHLTRTFSGTVRWARIERSFPPDARPIPELAAVLVAADAAGRLAGREIRFRDGPVRRLVAPEDPLRSDFAGYVFEVSFSLRDGRVLRAVYTPVAFASGAPVPMLILVCTALLAIFALAVALVLRALRPLVALERAALKLGQRLEPSLVEETGPVEVRRLAAALNQMQARIARLMSDRTRTYTSLAHDIRTVITRILLRIELDGPAALEGVTEDLTQIRTLLDDMMLYARSEHASEREELFDVVGLAREWAGATGIEVSGTEDPVWIAGDPMSLRRVLDNLGENARRYACDASLSVGFERDDLAIRVLDRGPGIAAADRERMFDPFERGEESRNRTSGGSGLGLGIARELMRSMGGDVKLEERDGGGLAACVLVPAARLVC